MVKTTSHRIGLGAGKGMGYKNLVPMDRYVHQLAGKGVKTYAPVMLNAKMSVGEAKQILGDRATWELKKMKRALRMLGALNTPEENKRLEAVETLLRERKRGGHILNAYRTWGNKLITLPDGYSVEVHGQRTRNGFRHIATLFKDGKAVGSATQNYINRTWESYEYETVINHVLNKNLPKPDAEKLQAAAKVNQLGEIDSQFKTTAAIAQLGDLFGKTDKESNDWKVRMLKAGISGLDIPADWDTLSEAEKKTRLDKVIALAKGEHRLNT